MQRHAHHAGQLLTLGLLGQSLHRGSNICEEWMGREVALAQKTPSQATLIPAVCELH